MSNEELVKALAETVYGFTTLAQKCDPVITEDQTHSDPYNRLYTQLLNCSWGIDNDLDHANSVNYTNPAELCDLRLEEYLDRARILLAEAAQRGSSTAVKTTIELAQNLKNLPPVLIRDSGINSPIPKGIEEIEIYFGPYAVKAPVSPKLHHCFERLLSMKGISHETWEGGKALLAKGLHGDRKCHIYIPGRLIVLFDGTRQKDNRLTDEIQEWFDQMVVNVGAKNLD